MSTIHDKVFGEGSYSPVKPRNMNMSLNGGSGMGMVVVLPSWWASLFTITSVSTAGEAWESGLPAARSGCPHDYLYSLLAHHGMSYIAVMRVDSCSVIRPCVMEIRVEISRRGDVKELCKNK